MSVQHSPHTAQRPPTDGDGEARRSRLLRLIENCKKSAAEAMGEAVQDYLDGERRYAAGRGDRASAAVLEAVQRDLRGIISEVCWEVTFDAWMDAAGEDDEEGA